VRGFCLVQLCDIALALVHQRTQFLNLLGAVRNATPSIIAASRWSIFLTNETSFDYIAATAFEAEPNGPFLVTRPEQSSSAVIGSPPVYAGGFSFGLKL
jgi:hypothetical protein